MATRKARKPEWSSLRLRRPERSDKRSRVGIIGIELLQLDCVLRRFSEMAGISVERRQREQHVAIGGRPVTGPFERRNGFSHPSKAVKRHRIIVAESCAIG